MLSKCHRLRDNNEFLYVLSKGKRHYFGGVLLYWVKNDHKKSRVGFIIGKKFSQLAVKRNKQKRIFRYATKDLLPKIVPGKDIVISYANHGKMLSYTKTREIILQILTKNDLIIK